MHRYCNTCRSLVRFQRVIIRFKPVIKATENKIIDRKYWSILEHEGFAWTLCHQDHALQTDMRDMDGSDGDHGGVVELAVVREHICIDHLSRSDISEKVGSVVGERLRDHTDRASFKMAAGMGIRLCAT